MKFAKYSISRLISTINSQKKVNSATALMFHNISKYDQEKFYDLIVNLKAEFDILTCNEFHMFINGELDNKGQKIFITFDDGFYSNFVIAKEVLNPLNIKSLFFVLPKFIEEKQENQKSFVIQSIYNGNVPNDIDSSDMISMSWENLSEIVDDGHSIGAHTNNHFRLSEIKDDIILRNEIIDSGDYIEKKLGIKVQDFAYPFGSINSINRNAMSIAKERYKFIYSGVRGHNLIGTNCAAIKREVIDIKDSLIFNFSLINGGLAPLYARQRKKLESLTL
tara:strand:- start:354 stop:1187 length:834 start_codon:yes stop_codon:yes gene_type:complete